MIFDQDYVASITENAFFDQLHLRLALDAGKHRQVELGASDVDPDILATYGLLDDILRFRELRQYRYPGGDEELRKTGARIALQRNAGASDRAGHGLRLFADIFPRARAPCDAF